jgi:oxygen-independent coproporphyrinogen-3 oxidase
MAGIYIHIPFCKSKCHYCNFFSLASLKYKDEIIQSILKEIVQKQNLVKEEINSIYFGGGTPSILQKEEIELILNTITQHYNVNSEAEITLEANPENIEIENLFSWKNSGINRLSIGLQSLNNEILQRLNRVHTAEQSLDSVKKALDFGFENLSIDFIFGIPNQTNEMLLQDLDSMVKLSVPHISAYNLTVESKTALDVLIRKKQYPTLDENQGVEQFYSTSDFLIQNGFEHYEISNYAKSGKYSKHNTNYWKREKYIGFGPSAHSYFLDSRSWNFSSIKEYIQQVESKNNFQEEEKLDKITQFNEFIMLGLRTKWGIDSNYLQQNYHEFYTNFIQKIAVHLQNKNVECVENQYILTRKGKIFADGIAAFLFV